MKASLKALSLVFVMALVAVACNKVEKVLPKKDGLWDVTSVHNKVTIDGAVFFDITMTDSLGTITFEKDGSGISTDFDGSTSSFTWSVNDDDSQITITDTTGSDVFDILESTKKHQEWFASDTDTTGGATTVSELTIVLDRPE